MRRCGSSSQLEISGPGFAWYVEAFDEYLIATLGASPLLSTPFQLEVYDSIVSPCYHYLAAFGAFC